MDTLINEQAYFILKKTDLLDIYKGIQNYDFKIQSPLINKLGMDTVSLRSAMVLFDHIKFFFQTLPNLQSKFDVVDQLFIKINNFIYQNIKHILK